MSQVTLSLSAATAIKALLQRCVRIEPQSLVRVHSATDGTVDIFVQTPFGTLASRRAPGSVDRSGAVLKAGDLLASIDGDELAASFATHDASWAGALPPATGFVLVDEVPAAVALDLATKGQALARQFSGPMGPPASLLDQTVLTVEGNAGTANITMREIFTCTSLGFIPSLGAQGNFPRHLRVSTCGRWVRIDAPFGSVYKSSGLSLLF